MWEKKVKIVHIENLQFQFFYKTDNKNLIFDFLEFVQTKIPINKRFLTNLIQICILWSVLEMIFM